jgi:hypothetical protein
VLFIVAPEEVPDGFEDNSRDSYGSLDGVVDIFFEWSSLVLLVLGLGLWWRGGGDWLRW